MEEEPLSETKEAELEARHRAGYERQPVEAGEFSDYEEQVWPEWPAATPAVPRSSSPYPGNPAKTSSTFRASA